MTDTPVQSLRLKLDGVRPMKDQERWDKKTLELTKTEEEEVEKMVQKLLQLMVRV